MEDVIALAPAVILLTTGIVAALLARAARTSDIVGFLLAGILIGPFGPFNLFPNIEGGLIENTEVVRVLANLGVVFLLFDIGLQFSLAEVKRTRRDLLGLAPAQMVFTTGAFFALGLALGFSWPIALILGGGLALSSTAVVMRVLGDRDIATCPLGSSTVAVLVFQDIIGIFLLVFATSLDGEGSLAVAAGLAAVKAAAAIAAALIIGRLIANPVFRFLAFTRNQEIFTAAAILVVLATAIATGALGLSLTLGAFLAGMIIAETPYRHVIQTETAPFRSLLMGFFFIVVGLILDVPAVIAQWPWVLAVTAAIFIVKTATTFAAAKLNGWSNPGAVQLSFLISQGSEFTLVILALAAVASGLALGPIPSASSVIVAAIALSLALTPLWSGMGMALSRYLASRQRKADDPEPVTADTVGFAKPGSVFVVGMTPVGRTVVDALQAFDVPVVAVDRDPKRFISAVADGYTVTFGDPSDLRFMELVGASRASALFLSESRYKISKDVTPYVNETYPKLKRVVVVSDEEDKARHVDLGMIAAIDNGDPPGIKAAVVLLQALGFDAEAIQEWLTDHMDSRENAEVFTAHPDHATEKAEDLITV